MKTLLTVATDQAVPMKDDDPQASASGVIDGYGPGEYDGFHWVKFLGSLLSGFIGFVLLSMMPGAEGEAATWLLLIGGGLLGCSLAAAWLSAFYRRYHFLIWWKKLIVLVPTWVGFMALVFVQQLFAYLFGSGGGAGARGSGRPNEAVDEDGNVYGWNSWGGSWEPRRGFMGLGQERGAVKHNLFGPVTKTGTFGASQYDGDGHQLYEKREP